MLEAVQNHTPQTLVIDEIGTSQEAYEAVSIRQRGIQLIATTHGETIADVIQNPTNRVLLGGVNTVILSAQERTAERAEKKTRLERRTAPAFDVCIEILAFNRWRVHHNVADAVDVVLRDLGEVVPCEIRTIGQNSVQLTTESFPDATTRISFELQPQELAE
uniref:Bacterial type II secretion system protein E domain-containing protein n=1 Tax=Vannella robusta TaxID=1487602 RepID=A0A7S4HQE6_9EUKA|mmetsp:Transcript_14208/g.17989  ORF Transcript_14208/g.17989 Transcript_14208/m.17989 type:complete len:162 (+) Transcript_14208:1558-2043(+)